jgi:hypothetical protein
MTLVAKLASIYPAISSHLETTQRILTVYVLIVLAMSGALAFLIREREPFFIIVNLGILLVSNITWYHHYVFILLPLFVWIAWSRNTLVLSWCLLGLTLIQVDRWLLTKGLLIQIFGHLSILLVLAWQMHRGLEWTKRPAMLIKAT